MIDFKGWEPGIQEGAALWDEEWDKFEDEGMPYGSLPFFFPFAFKCLMLPFGSICLHLLPSV